MSKRFIHIEQNDENLILDFKNVGIAEIAVMIGDSLEAICNDDRLLGNNTSEDAKKILINIILAKLGYMGCGSGE